MASTSRQVGAVVGLAILIAVLGATGAGTPVSTFHRAWLLMVATGLGSGVIAGGLGRVRARNVELAPKAEGVPELLPQAAAPS